MKRDISFRKDSYIYTKGSQASSCYIIKNGQVNVKIEDFEPITINKGGIFGLYNLLNNTYHRESAVAKTDCEVCELNKEDALNLITSDKELRKNAIVQTIDLIKMINKKVESKSIYSEDNISEKIYEGLIYYYSRGEMTKASELYERLEIRHSKSESYLKALEKVKELIQLNKIDEESNTD